MDGYIQYIQSRMKEGCYRSLILKLPLDQSSSWLAPFKNINQRFIIMLQTNVTNIIMLKT